MRNFISAIFFCVFLSILGLVLFLPSSKAQVNVLQSLLNLPAPPPPNPLVEKRSRNRSPEFYSQKKPPGDDVSIQDLFDYWAVQNQLDPKFTYTIKPDAKTIDRMKDEIEKNPEKLASVLNTLPADESTIDFVKRIYEKGIPETPVFEDDHGGDFESDWKASFDQWLRYKTNTYSDQLQTLSLQVKDNAGYVTNQAELLALAKVDWSKAEPILNRLLNDSSQPVSQTLARWAFYQHALQTNSIGDIEKYRNELKDTVENKSATPGMRDLAMDAIVESGEFAGRDDWYYSLLEDETLHDLKINGQTYTGLTTLLNHSPSDKYKEKMLELVKSSSAVVRSAAVRNLTTLIDDNDPEVIRALLPWLEDPKWAKEVQGNERQMIITALRIVKIPESVQGLLAVLNEKQTREVQVYPNANVSARAMANRATPVANMSVDALKGEEELQAGVRLQKQDFYPFRSAAIGSLETQRDPNAAGALRVILPEVEEWERQSTVRAIMACGGFSIQEQVDSLETVAKQFAKQQEVDKPANAAANAAISAAISASNVVIERPISVTSVPVGNFVISDGGEARYRTFDKFNPSQIPALLGMQLVNWQDVSDELITAVISRIEVLEKKEPKVALALRNIIKAWNGKGVNSLLLRDLKSGKADTESIVKLLALRKEIREKQQDEIFDVRTENATALGISACLLEDNSDYDAMLGNENPETKIALFGCARLIRAELPIARVAENLRDSNKMLSLAAEKYLESVDSPEARKFVLAQHPNEAKILGARTSFSDEQSVYTDSISALFSSVRPDLVYEDFGVDGNLVEIETRLRKEIKEDNQLLGIYSYDSNFIKIYRDKAVFSIEEDKARYRERTLDTEEFNSLKSFLASENVDQLSPFVGDCERYCQAKELIMVGKNGGRRVFIRMETPPKFFADLDKLLAEMRRPKGKLHYWLEKYVSGLEVLFEDEKLQARTVWKSGSDLSVLIEDAPRRKLIDSELKKAEEYVIGDDSEVDYNKTEKANRKRREAREFEEFSWRKLASGSVSAFATQPSGVEFIPRKDSSGISSSNEQWKSRAAGFEIRSSMEGLFKVSPSKTTKLRDESYFNPFVTPNGAWLIAAKYTEEGVSMVRINLSTNKEYKVAFEEFPVLKVLSFVQGLNKFLVLGGYYFDGEGGEYEDVPMGVPYFLDPETGRMTKAKGEIRPLQHLTFRQLQPSGILNESWAAINTGDSTEVGRYDTKLLTFKPMIKLPKIRFDSMEMFVDEIEGKVYFVYEGHLLSVPFTKTVQNLPSE
jgi:hypothetical protein